MTNVLYSEATGEIRGRAFDVSSNPINNATVTCTLYTGDPFPQAVFTDRVMTYDAGHPFTDSLDLGCYFCVVTALEMSAPVGVWRAVILVVDQLGNELPINAYISVEPYVTS